MREFAGIRKILVPVDFSEHVPLLVRYALEIVRGRGATVRLLHVVGAPAATVDPVRGSALDPAVQEKLVEEARGKIDELVTGIRGIAVDARVVSGFAAHEIVREAAEWEADVVVIGTHGRTGFKRVILGSVAEAVVRRCPCPVLTVRRGAVEALEHPPG